MDYSHDRVTHGHGVPHHEFSHRLLLMQLEWSRGLIWLSRNRGAAGFGKTAGTQALAGAIFIKIILISVMIIK